MRTFTPYEITQLKRAGWDPDQFTGRDPDEPVEYLTGRVEFAGSVFRVSPDTLIPRIETEELVEQVVAEPLWQRSGITAIEVGTGSGALGLSVMKRLRQLGRPDAQWYLTDLSPSALEMARINAQQLLPNFPVQFIVSDLLEKVSPQTKFDCVIANLPYIPHERLAELPRSVTAYEPQLALDGGARGTAVINQLLTQLQNRLNPQAVVWLEIDESQNLADFESTAGKLTLNMKQDSWGKPRFMRGEQP